MRSSATRKPDARAISLLSLTGFCLLAGPFPCEADDSPPKAQATQKLVMNPEAIVPFADVESDLKELISIFKDVHPQPFWSLTEEQIREKFQSQLGSLKSSAITQRDLFRLVSKLVVLFDDPHCWVVPPGYEDYRDGAGKLLPLTVRFDAQEALITFAPRGSNVLVPSRLLAINGEEIGTLIREFRPLTGQSDDPFGDEFLATFFRRYLWYLRGWDCRFDIEFEHQGVRGRTTMTGLSNENYLKEMGLVDKAESLTFRELGNEVGLIEFRGCDEVVKTRSLCDAMFTKIADLGIKRLVIDARDNTGGGDDAWHTLLEYLTDKPYSGYAETRYRTSQRLKELLGKEEFTMGYGPDAWEASAGTEFVISRRRQSDLVTPPNNPKKFNGRWAVISGRRTFSSGMSFVCAVKAYGLAPLVGTETGGRVKGFGQSIPFMLPHSGVIVFVSTKQFNGAVDVPFRRGVPPDIILDNKFGNGANSFDDTVLNAAQDALR